MNESAEIRVMATAAVKEAFAALVPAFERSSGCRVTSLWMPTVDMMHRLAAGEVVDVVLLTAAMIDELIAAGVIASGSRVGVVRSSVGMAIRAGASRPDIGSVEAFTQAMLEARSIGYSTGPSGVYIAQLFERLGIAAALRERVRQVKGVPVGALVAKGEVEFGFQQMSELQPVAGIETLGALPPGIECTTVFSTGIHVRSAHPQRAGDWVRYLISPQAAPIMRRTGLEPLAGR